MKSAHTSFLFDPDLTPGIDLGRDYRLAPKRILDLFTSKFPTGSFLYPKATQGNVPGLGCNRYATPRGNIQVCLFVRREKHESGWLECGLLTWLLIPYSFFRPWYEPNESDFQVIADFRIKCEAILIHDLGAKEVLTEI